MNSLHLVLGSSSFLFPRVTEGVDLTPMTRRADALHVRRCKGLFALIGGLGLPWGLPSRSNTSDLILGRHAERAAVDGLVNNAVSGRSGALVLRGEAGIGKTTLLEYAVESAGDMQIARIVGVQSEMELAFAGIHQLLVPMLSRLPDLPSKQGDALALAFGLKEGVTPDRLLVGSGVLGLLAATAEDRPLLCVIDDAQWLDRTSADVLAFAGRRLRHEGIAMLFAERDEETPQLAGLPELRLEGLDREDARELLYSVVKEPLSEGLRECIITEAHGNPLAIKEFPEAMTREELWGSVQLSWPLPLTKQLEELFGRRIKELPDAARTFLLLASAASPADDPGLLSRGAELLGVDPDSAAPAIARGFLRIDTQVSFRHPLIRTAAYGVATEAERRRAHEVLAEVTDAIADPDQRAWHLAAAAVGPNENVATELARAADRARKRGGFAAAAACLKRAAQLSPSSRDRAERFLAAAEAEIAAGCANASTALVNAARSESLDEGQTARAQRLRGLIAFELGALEEASTILVDAARSFGTLDVRLARDTHLAALGAAMYAGPLASRGTITQAAAAALEAPNLPESEVTGADYLLDGFATQVLGDLGSGAALLRRGIAALRESEDLRLFGMGCGAALRVFDDKGLRDVAARGAELARDQGALTALHVALHHLALSDAGLGRFAAAEASVEEAREISAAIGNGWSLGRHAPVELLVAAWRGDGPRTRSLFDTAVREATARGEGSLVLFAENARAVLEIGQSRYVDALPRAKRASGDPVAMLVMGLPELIEAAVHCGERDIATEAARRLSDVVQPGGSSFGLGMEARSRALLADRSEAEALYLEAIDFLKDSGITPQLARAYLVYGEWLRRIRRRLDARRPLREALELFESIGAEAFAERARVELRATGEHARSRTSGEGGELTAQETLVARLVAQGASNPEVAAQLSISRKTVESHLSRIFAKLGISSRSLLAGALENATE